MEGPIQKPRARGEVHRAISSPALFKVRVVRTVSSVYHGLASSGWRTQYSLAQRLSHFRRINSVIMHLRVVLERLLDRVHRWDVGHAGFRPQIEGSGRVNSTTIPQVKAEERHTASGRRDCSVTARRLVRGWRNLGLFCSRQSPASPVGSRGGRHNIVYVGESILARMGGALEAVS